MAKLRNQTNQTAKEMSPLAEQVKPERKKAEATLLRTIEAHPESDPAYHGLGLMAYEAGNLTKATEFISRAILLAPSNGLYHRNFGELCRRLGRLDEAIKAARQATALCPSDSEAHFNLGLALADSNDWPEAIASYQQTLSLKPNHGLALNNLGVALLRVGRRTEALQAFLNATQLNPSHIEAQLNLAILIKQSGQVELARNCLAVVNRLAPGFAEKQSFSLNDCLASIAPPRISVRDTCSPRGRGVFAEREFFAGEIVETAPVILLNSGYANLPPEIKAYVFNWGALCGVGKAHALALGYGGLYNHDNPACLRYEADSENISLKFIATRNIASAEELTINYDNAIGIETKSGSDWFAQLGTQPILASSKQT